MFVAWPAPDRPFRSSILFEPSRPQPLDPACFLSFSRHPQTCQVCLWLSLFFRVREDTKEACQASCYGVLVDLAKAAEAQPDGRILAQVRDSIQLL